MPTDQNPSTDAKRIEFRYTNYFEIGYNEHEILIDCGHYYAGDKTPSIHTRLVTSPAYAESLLKLLGDSLRQRRLSAEDESSD